MGKLVHDDVLDAALEFLADNATYLCVNSAEPSTYSEAYDIPGSAGYCLARTATDAFDDADFTITNGTVSGRRTTVLEQVALDILATGTATHISIVGTDSAAANALLYVTTCAAMELTISGLTDVPTFNIELRDPI